jgi:diaminopimelate decarboxylase
MQMRRLDQSDEPDAAELVAARPFLSRHAADGLVLEDVPLAAIADKFGTPCWVYGAGEIRARYRRLAAAMPGVAIHYAVKANDHPAVIAVLAAEGAGADVVSIGEFQRATRAGIPADRVLFSGVGKTGAELEATLLGGVGQINVESAEELSELSALAMRLGRHARVALRVNPDVDAGTHDKISTGRAGDKFGIPYGAVAELYAQDWPGIDLVGLAVHIGSQVFSAAPFRAAYERLADLVRTLRGQDLRIEMVDCGGGIGIGYRNEPAALPEAWAGAMQTALGDLGVRLAIEPGRWLVGPAGVLLSRTIRTRRMHMPRPLVVLDAAMNDLVRPAMYGAWHGIVPVGAADLAAPAEPADIAGPVCESSDYFARDRMIAPLQDGAAVAILDAGAYGAVMSSTYNARALAAAVMVDGARMSVIRPRQSLAASWEADMVPDWLAHD